MRSPRRSASRSRHRDAHPTEERPSRSRARTSIAARRSTPRPLLAADPRTAPGARACDGSTRRARRRPCCRALGTVALRRAPCRRAASPAGPPDAPLVFPKSCVSDACAAPSTAGPRPARPPRAPARGGKKLCETIGHVAVVIPALRSSIEPVHLRPCLAGVHRVVRALVAGVRLLPRHPGAHVRRARPSLRPPVDRRPRVVQSVRSDVVAVLVPDDLGGRRVEGRLGRGDQLVACIAAEGARAADLLHLVDRRDVRLQLCELGPVDEVRRRTRPSLPVWPSRPGARPRRGRPRSRPSTSWSDRRGRSSRRGRAGSR